MERMRVLRCGECGAAVSYSAEAMAPKCVFCSAVMHVETPVDPVEAVELLVPFTVAPDEADAALRHWLSNRGWSRPSDLAAQAAIERLKPLFWAAWVIDANALVSWVADSNAGAQVSAWAPHAGQTSLPFRNLLVPATRGLTHAETTGLSNHCTLASAIPAPGSGGALPGPWGAVVEAFDLQRSAARGAILGAIGGRAVAAIKRGVIPGSRYRNVRTAVLLESLVSARVGLPAYVFAYRYKDKTFRAVVHGQDARIVLGSAPRSTEKSLTLVVVVVFALILAVLFFRC